MRIFKELYQYRELLKSNVKKEIRGKYKGSFLGIIWSFVNPLLISCIIILLFTILGGLGISYTLIYLPFVVLIQFILSLGFVFILSAINVYIRDVEYIVNFVLTLAFYATPILYDASLIPAKLGWLLNLNPMKHLIDAYRAIFYYQQSPNLQVLFFLFLISFGILILGYLIFKRLERGFAEEV